MILFLTLIWSGFVNHYAWPDVIFGLVVSTVIVLIFRRKHSAQYFHVLHFIHLLGIVLMELIMSSVLVAKAVIKRRLPSQDVIVSIPLCCQTEVEKTLLANLISLTPGTVTIDLTDDQKSLQVHVMFGDEADHFVAFIQKVLEPKIMRVFHRDVV